MPEIPESRESRAEGSFSASSIHDLVDMFESWAKVQELSEDISGVRAQLIDSRGKVVAGNESLPLFCQLIQNSKIGENRCYQSYHKCCLSAHGAKNSGKSFVCHAGLTNVAFSLHVNKKPVGAIVCGRAIAPGVKVDSRSLKQMAGELGINGDQLIAATNSLHRMGDKDPELIAKLLKPFVDSLGGTMMRYFSLIEKTESLIDAARESEDLLFVDRLTGLFNKRYLTPRLTSEIARSQRYNHPISLVLMEIDNFDEQLPEYAHLAADIVLIEVSRMIEKTARKAEVVVRMGERQFALILPEADHDQALKVAERIRKNIVLKHFGEEAGLSIDLTMSFGISSLLKDATAEKLLAKAEEMLQQAKDQGGNRIRVAELPNGTTANRGATTYVPSAKTSGKRRVVITGLGVITPVGVGADQFWKGLKKGKSTVGRINRFDTSGLPAHIGATVDGFEPEAFINPKDLRRMDRFTRFAVAATKMAIEDADLNIDDVTRTGVMLGTNIGGIEFGEEQHALLLNQGFRSVSPFLAIAFSIGSSSSQISLAVGAKGKSLTIGAECASGAAAIATGFEQIQNGVMDVMIAGGAEAPITPIIISALGACRLLSTEDGNPEIACRPFDIKRDGMVLGEGAGIVILESLDHALARDAKIYAELVSYGMTCDAYHMVRPDPYGQEVARAMSMALKNGNLSPRDIDYINAHGSSTQANDAIETHAIKTVFGEHAARLPVSATKSIVGHAIGAVGGIECVATTLAVANDFVPPTANYQYPDPDCDLDYVPNKGRSTSVEMAMSNSFGFGGKNTILILGKYMN